MGWFRRKAKKPTLEQVHMTRLMAMFEARPRPKVLIPPTTITNNTGRREYVLTFEQWQEVARRG